MRKLVCLCAVLCLTASASAGDITFTASSSANGEFTIGYNATDPDDVPVGIGIKVTLTGGCSATVSNGDNIASASADFDVYIDYAHDDPCNYVIGAGHPLADPCAAGQVLAGSSEFSICMGRLDPCVPAPQNVPNLVTINVDCDATCTIDVDIEADGLRGGIVGADFGATVFVDGTLECVIGCPIECWECPTQCHGDANCDGVVNTVDWPYFRDGFAKTYPDADYVANVCGDYNHDGTINTVDWPEFRDNFASAPPADCPMPCVWPPVIVP